MGQLQNLEATLIPQLTVPVAADAGFAVRGLSPYDLVAIYLRHRGEVSNLFDDFAARIKAGDTAGLDDGFALVMSSLQTMPHLIAEVIAMATGSDAATEDFEREVKVVLKMSIGVQSSALEKIGKLTFTDEMPVGKFLSLALESLKGANAGLPTAISLPA